MEFGLLVFYRYQLGTTVFCYLFRDFGATHKQGYQEALIDQEMMRDIEEAREMGQKCEKQAKNTKKSFGEIPRKFSYVMIVVRPT